MKLVACVLAAASLTFGLSVHAQDANLKKTLTERIPSSKNRRGARHPMSGLYEVRVGTDIFYTDAKGNYLIQGELIDTKARRNLTEDRMTQLTAVDFKQLPSRTPSPSCMARASAKWPCSKTRTAATASALKRPAERGQRHHLSLSLPHPEPRFGRKVTQYLVRQGSGQGLA